MSFSKSNETLNKYAINFLKPNHSFKDIAGMAYADMARHTLKSKGDSTYEKKLNAKKKKQIRDNIIDMLKREISGLSRIKSREDFDAWHEKVCESMINEYRNADILAEAFTHGQAQKWLNMIFKYLYVYDVKSSDTSNQTMLESAVGANSPDEFLKWLHAPVDSYVIKNSEIEVDITWSKWEFARYKDFQNQLRSSKADEGAFLWEVENWADWVRKSKKA